MASESGMLVYIGKSNVILPPPTAERFKRAPTVDPESGSA